MNPNGKWKRKEGRKTDQVIILGVTALPPAAPHTHSSTHPDRCKTGRTPLLRKYETGLSFAAGGCNVSLIYSDSTSRNERGSVLDILDSGRPIWLFLLSINTMKGVFLNLVIEVAPLRRDMSCYQIGHTGVKDGKENLMFSPPTPESHPSRNVQF